MALRTFFYDWSVEYELINDQNVRGEGRADDFFRIFQQDLLNIIEIQANGLDENNVFNIGNSDFGDLDDTRLLIAHVDHGTEATYITRAENANGAVYLILIGQEFQHHPQSPHVMLMPRDPQRTPGLDRFVRHLVEISNDTRPTVNLRLLLPNPIPEATLSYYLVLLARQQKEEADIPMPKGLKKALEAEFKKAGEELPQEKDSIANKIEKADAVIEKNYGKK